MVVLCTGRLRLDQIRWPSFGGERRAAATLLRGSVYVQMMPWIGKVSYSMRHTSFPTRCNQDEDGGAQPPRTVVPFVVGNTVFMAEGMIRSANLTPMTSGPRDGKVYSQMPGAGTSVPINSTVWISAS